MPGQNGLMWFTTLTGFRERDVTDIALQFRLEGNDLMSVRNGRWMRCGEFEAPSLGELRHRQKTAATTTSGSLQVREVVADIGAMHADPANAGALFQVASQFNTLEMATQFATPEAGIDGYENDHTQGPACAIACGAGTIYRNYLMPIDGGIGQTANRQLNCLADLVDGLEVDVDMLNGYALPTAAQLDAANKSILDASDADRDALLARLRIGVQWNTEVTVAPTGHTVTQAFCSATPVGYSDHSTARWEPLARIVLDAAYEATLTAAALNAAATGNHTVYLTLIGGGVFGNPLPWILDALQRALTIFADTGLDIGLVSHRAPNPALQPLLNNWRT
jgi:hypothetical protein